MPHTTPRFRTLLLLASLALGAVTAPAQARPGDYRPGGWGSPDLPRDRTQSDDGEGRVDAARFVKPDLPPGTLGHGLIAVTAVPGALADTDELAVYEAAVTDRLVHAGYDTAVAANPGWYSLPIHADGPLFRFPLALDPHITPENSPE